MRKLFLYAALIFGSIQMHAQQSVGIGTTTPNSSAILDVSSTTKGLLLPRMTAGERMAIGSPAPGLVVYETTSNAFFYYNGTGWAPLGSGGGGSDWLVNGTHIYNGNTGNVGIGLNAPTSKFHLAGNMLMNNTNPILQFQNDGIDKGFVQLSGNNLRLGTNGNNGAGKIVFRAFGNDHVFIDSIGQVGIGTSTPDQKLHVVNGKMYLQDNRVGNNPHLIFDNPAVDYKEGGLQWQRSGDTLASLNYVANPNFTNYLHFKVGDGSSMSLNNSGLGLGFVDPQAKLHIRQPDGDAVIRLDAINPEIEFRKKSGAQLFTWNQIGFLQTTSTNDLRIGTYSANATGKFVIRTGGDDRVFVNDVGNVGIGTDIPSAKLQVHAGGSTENLRIYNPVGGLVQFTTGINTSQLKKGFLDVSGNDFRIGTNSENNNGNFILRVNGENRLIIDPAGTVNLTGGVDASLTSNGYLMIGAPSSSNIIIDNNEILARINGATTTLVLQHDGGSVRIGNVAVPAGYKFGINGKMICEELKVKLASSGWPDYVFDKKYKLPTLQELENFIHQNKHLPNIPSAADVDKNGIEVGDMQKRMMEKIEELTLYIINLQKQVDELKKEKGSN